MDEAGVSRSVEISRSATDPEPPQISVNTYPTSPEKTDRSNDSHDSRTSGEKTTTRYPYASMFFLLGNTIGQSYSGTGLQAVLELYFAPFLYICSGVSRAKKLSTTSVNIYIALYQLCALSAGFLADKIFGNFIIQTISVIVSTGGLFLLTFSTWQLTLDQPHCCSEANYSSFALMSHQSGISTSSSYHANCSELNKVTFLEHLGFGISPALNIALAIIGLVLYAVGYGQINTLQSVLVADQFTEDQSKSKERSFSWFYLCCNVGSLVGESGMPIIRQTVGFVVAWMTVFGSSVVSLVLFLAGSCFYVKKKPQRPTCGCSRNSKHHIHAEPSVNALGDNQEHKPLLNGTNPTQYSKETNQPTPSSSSSPQIEKASKSTLLSRLTRLKELLPFLGVFGPLIVFWAIFYQQNSTWILQGAQMNCHLGKLQVPPDLMPSVNDFMVILIIPMLDYLVYPHLEKTMGYKVQSLHKLVGGMMAAALSFLMSGLLQLYLPADSSNVPYCHGDISIMWQLPQLLLISFAEVLVSVTGLEFAYSQAPPDFRNIITSFWYISQALGTLLNAGIAQIPGLTLLKEFFTYMALMFVVTFGFILINWRFRYRSNKEDQRT